MSASSSSVVENVPLFSLDFPSLISPVKVATNVLFEMNEKIRDILINFLMTFIKLISQSQEFSQIITYVLKVLEQKFWVLILTRTN